MDKEKNVSSFSKDECIYSLKDIGLPISGTKEELQLRIGRFIRYPKIVNKLRKKAHSNYVFLTR